ncbi:short-chain dehydrogenase [Gammaproteobacteria bacterium 45_16_T64]|nr:short-chain dehydrogenase [Gammaproteobacteria bacterium 45_16_T64]
MPDSTSAPSVALIMGAGDAIGSSIATQFARSGHTVCLARRNGDKLESIVGNLKEQGLEAHGFSCDARNEEQVIELFKDIEDTVGPIEVVVFNVGANVPMDIVNTSSRKFMKIWEMACFAGFLTGREAAKTMLPRKRGTIIFTGATASVRGGANFAAFASAKHGLRALAQSMARELGPKNIHVAHVVIDAAVDTQWIRENHPAYNNLIDKDGIVNTDDLAKNYVMLHEQPRSAWTFELDVRPWVENW